MIQDVKPDFFQTHLQARGDVRSRSVSAAPGCARRTKRARKLVREDSANDRRALVPGHVDAFSMMAKVIKVQAKLAARFGANDVAKLVR